MPRPREAWILGCKYDVEPSIDGEDGGLPALSHDALDDIQSRIWCTYRTAFPPFSTGADTDIGWGCLLRCGQMLLAEAYSRLLLGRDWRIGRLKSGMMGKNGIHGNRESERIHLDLVRQFGDHPTRPFSIHRIANGGVRLGKRIGEWFGPSTVANVLPALVREYHDSASRSEALGGAGQRQLRLNVQVFMDGVIYRSQIDDASKAEWHPLLLLAPVKLGAGAKINPVYIEELTRLFTLPQLVGIAGGKPRASVCFVGCVGDRLLYLDPHVVQAPEDLSSPSSRASSYHYDNQSSLRATDIDPSLLLAFLCTTPDELDALLVALDSGAQPAQQILQVQNCPPSVDHVGDAEEEDDFLLI